MTFVIGKKYIHDTIKNTIYEPVYMNEDGALVKYYYDNHKPMYTFISIKEFKQFKEYKEPVVHKCWVHFFKYKIGEEVFSVSNKNELWRPNPKNWIYLGNTPVEFTKKDN